LFVALAFGWAIFWAVLYPLQRQWEGQHEALILYQKDNKNCDQLVVERPQWALTNDCYHAAYDQWKIRSEFYSYKHFWGHPVAFWRSFLPLIVLPPFAVYGLAALSAWIWRGFKPRASN
jgi:hypothetical protein